MARNGHCHVLAHGSELAAQIGYRLAGITTDKSLSRADQEAQVDYRLGHGSVDSRQVWFLGCGQTAAHLGYRPGERVTAADGQIVRDAMFGIDRQTDRQIRIRRQRNRHARIAAAPYYDVIQDACRAGAVDPQTLWQGRDRSACFRALSRAADRPRGTVALRSAEMLLRSNEHAWAIHQQQLERGIASEPPRIRLDRCEVMRRLGGHHRALQESGDEQSVDGKPLDMSLDDEALGQAVWEAVAEAAKQRIVTGNAGYELTVTCPKSLSVAALFDDPDMREEWLTAVRDAVSGATDELMRRVGHGRTGHEGDGQRATPIQGLGYAATVSIESYSRELDPHLHGHVMIPNRVVCADGIERTIATGGSDLINHAWWFQAEFERRLRAITVERHLVTGWEFNLSNRQWEVAGADSDVMEFYSQAHVLVRAETLADLDGEGPAVTKRRLRVLDSRAKRRLTRSKSEQTLTWQQVRDRATDRAQHAGMDTSRAFARAAPEVWTQPDAWNPETWARVVEEVVCETKGAEITARIEGAVRAFAPHDWSDVAISNLISDVIAREFTTTPAFARGRVGSRRHASNRVLHAEQRACIAFTDGYDANTHALNLEQARAGLAAWREASEWAADGREFTPGQGALFWQMTCGRDRVSTVVGAAGSGKTTAVDAARAVLAANGQQVYGVTVAAIAAQALRDTARVEAGTLTWLTMRISYATDPEHPARLEHDRLAASRSRRDQALAAHIERRFAIPTMDHLVIDEASMVPATDLATVLEWAGSNDVTVTLIGDSKQLQPVGPSGLFGQLHAARPGAELTENLRQRGRIGQECAAFLRDGDPETAFALLADAGQLVVVASQTEADNVLVRAWAERAAETTDPLERLAAVGLESDRNDQVDILNARARVEARCRGWITGLDHTFTSRGKRLDVAVGDQIIITHNLHRRGRPSLANGTRAVVTAIADDYVDIAYRESGVRRVDRLASRQLVRHARHGYAMTTHKLQGRTLDRLVVDVGPDRDLSSAYVAFTRHRDDVLAVINIADIATGPEVEALVHATPDARRDGVLAMAAERMAARGFADAATAHTHLRVQLPLRTSTDLSPWRRHAGPPHPDSVQ